MSSKKMGRPTSDPKPHSLHVRVNDSELNILDEYCKKNDKTRAQGIRDGINTLKDK
ncbi:hypothetical protein SH1V18_34700 [Vallitalea longa]|uniref:Ribbon-helix-helix protein CopG domain-containing protein n=1 Tax=Vallitalea longa TaxID=2936439 RepID=A0A9W6DFW0_9FIRM|nr:hypothetical protein [Vallitalea longa]GKX30990.1 hypothetical protein SH1V18_34700 [Vallitalea longa]